MLIRILITLLLLFFRIKPSNKQTVSAITPRRINLTCPTKVLSKNNLSVGMPYKYPQSNRFNSQSST